MSTKQNVSFGGAPDPQQLLLQGPDLIIQQQQLQRKQALIDALRQQSLDPIDGGRGAISWTQGAAKLANALVARQMQKSNDKIAAGVYQGMQSRQNRMFGLGPDGSPLQRPMPQQQAPQSPAQPFAQGMMGARAAMQPPATSAPSITPVDPDAALNAPTQPQQAPQAPPMQQSAGQPPMQPPQQQDAASYPMSLTGNPQQDAFYYASNPDEFTKQLITSHAPVEMARTVQQAQDALNRGDIATANALLANVQKQNNIPPVVVRGGSAALDPVTHKPIFAMPQLEKGQEVVFDANGQPTGVRTADGFIKSLGDITATEAGAKKAGESPYELVQVSGPNGQSYYVPKAALLQGGGLNDPNAPRGAVGLAAPPPGTKTAYDVTGTNSANGFQSISDMGADVPNRILALKSMQQLVNDPRAIFGQGSVGLNKVSGYLGTLTGGEAPNVTNANEFNKWAAQYSARSAQELGLNGSDSRVQLAVHATPNGEMTRGALQNIVPQMIGLENAKAGMATASVQWQQVHGPQSLQEFRTAWNQNYDPRIYTWMAQGPQVFAANVKHLPPGERNALKGKYLELKRIGALPQ